MTLPLQLADLELARKSKQRRRFSARQVSLEPGRRGRASSCPERENLVHGRTGIVTLILSESQFLSVMPSGFHRTCI